MAGTAAHEKLMKKKYKNNVGGALMADYQKMYHSLFNDVTDTIQKLQEAQRKTEEIYIQTDKAPVKPIHRSDDDGSR
jgi:hypothetical protein